jgi:hypothetical protein
LLKLTFYDIIIVMETLSIKHEMSPAASHYLGSMRALSEFTSTNFNMPIIDHDFGPDHQPADTQPGSLEGFSRDIGKQLDAMPDDEPQAIALRRNLKATRFMLDVLAGKVVIGKDIDYPSAVETVMGVRPVFIPETVAEGGAESIEGQKQAIEQTLNQIGFDFSPDSRHAFMEKFSVPGEQLQETIEDLVGPTKEHLSQQLGHELTIGLDKVDIEVKDMSPATWQAFFGAHEPRQFFALFNSNPLLKLTRQEEWKGVVHELTHAASSTHKEQLIAQGLLSPALGPLLIFSPAYTQEEIIARSTEVSLPENDTVSRLASMMTNLRVDVHNNMILHANTGSSLADATKYGIDNLPFDEPDKVSSAAKEYASDDIKYLPYKTVFAVDSHVLRAGRRINSLPPAERQALLAQLCSGPVDVAALLRP